MARASWLDDNAGVPLIQEQIQELDSFTSALADRRRPVQASCRHLE